MEEEMEEVMEEEVDVEVGQVGASRKMSDL